MGVKELPGWLTDRPSMRDHVAARANASRGQPAGSPAAPRASLGRSSPARERAAALVRLAHHRWSIPLLAELASRAGARISELAHRLGGSRTAVRQAAEALVHLGLLAPLEGHGHPLRPEVVLTDAGRRAAGAAERLEAAVAGVGAGRLARRNGLARRKWTLPVLHALGSGARRYGYVRRALPGVTDRALSGALRDLEAAGLVTREVVEDAPPFTRYRARPAGRAIAAAAEELASAPSVQPDAELRVRKGERAT